MVFCILYDWSDCDCACDICCCRRTIRIQRRAHVNESKIRSGKANLNDDSIADMLQDVVNAVEMELEFVG